MCFPSQQLPSLEALAGAAGIGCSHAGHFSGAPGPACAPLLPCSGPSPPLWLTPGPGLCWCAGSHALRSGPKFGVRCAAWAPAERGWGPLRATRSFGHVQKHCVPKPRGRGARCARGERGRGLSTLRVCSSGEFGKHRKNVRTRRGLGTPPFSTTTPHFRRTQPAPVSGCCLLSCCCSFKGKLPSCFSLSVLSKGELRFLEFLCIYLFFAGPGILETFPT